MSQRNANYTKVAQIWDDALSRFKNDTQIDLSDSEFRGIHDRERLAHEIVCRLKTTDFFANRVTAMEKALHSLLDNVEWLVDVAERSPLYFEHSLREFVFGSIAVLASTANKSEKTSEAVTALFDEMCRSTSWVQTIGHHPSRPEILVEMLAKGVIIMGHSYKIFTNQHEPTTDPECGDASLEEMMLDLERQEYDTFLPHELGWNEAVEQYASRVRIDATSWQHFARAHSWKALIAKFEESLPQQQGALQAVSQFLSIFGESQKSEFGIVHSRRKVVLASFISLVVERAPTDITAELLSSLGSHFEHLAPFIRAYMTRDVYFCCRALTQIMRVLALATDSMKTLSNNRPMQRAVKKLGHLVEKTVSSPEYSLRRNYTMKRAMAICEAIIEEENPAGSCHASAIAKCFIKPRYIPDDSWAWPCLGIYQISFKYLLSLCSYYIDELAIQLRINIANSPKNLYLAHIEGWFRDLYRHYQVWSVWSPVTLLARSKDIKVVLSDLHSRCPRELLEKKSLLPNKTFELSPSETLEAIKTVQSSKKMSDELMLLDGPDIMSVIDLYDQVVVFVEDEKLRKKIERTLRKLCAMKGTLPSSLHLSALELHSLPHVACDASGGYADVWHGEYKNRCVALKVFRITHRDALSDVRKFFCKEAIAWRHLSHPNIVQFLGIRDDLESSLCMVSEWMDHGTISTYLKANAAADRHALLVDVMQGLQYLHSPNIGMVHGDLKSSNILVNNQHRACLSDFGLASIINDSNTATALSQPSKPQGSTRWMAPELLDPEKFGLKKSKPTFRTDIYALGMVMLEVFSGKLPFSDKKQDATVICLIMKGDRPPRPLESSRLGLSDGIWALMQKCWDQHFDKRPSIEDVVRIMENEVSLRESGTPKSSFTLVSRFASTVTIRLRLRQSLVRATAKQS